MRISPRRRWNRIFFQKLHEISSHRRLVAFESGELAGTIVLREPNTEILPGLRPELGGLYVDKACRGHGVGTALVRSGMELAREQGYETVYATTGVAAGILERLGWEFIQTVDHRGEQLALYRCKLSDSLTKSDIIYPD